MCFAPSGSWCFTRWMKYSVLVALLCAACMADFERTGATGTSQTGADTSDGGDGDGSGEEDGDCPDSQTVPDWPGCWRIGGRAMSCADTCQSWGPFDAAGTQHTGAPIALHFFGDFSMGEALLAVECVNIDARSVYPSTGELPTGEEWHAWCNPVCSCNT